MGKGAATLLAFGILAAGSIITVPAMADEASRPIRVPFDVAAPTKQVVVVKGDHLWKISDRHLSGMLGRGAHDHEVSPYWRLVIETNRKSLRSGDPNLIYPGEVVTLPPLP